MISSIKSLLMAALVVAIFLVGLPAPTQAQPVFSLDSEVLTNYVTPNGVAYDDAVAQGSLTATWNNGVYAFIWGSQRLGGSNPYSNEADYGLGYAFTWAELDVDIGIEYQDLADRFGNWDMVVPHLELSRDFGVKGGTLTLFLRTEGWFATNQTDDGWITSAGIRASRDVTEKWIIDASAAANHDSGAFGGAAGVGGDFSASLGYKLNSSTTIGVSGRYVVAQGGDFRENEAVGGVFLRITDLKSLMNSLRR